jgi:hypothetical protein
MVEEDERRLCYEYGFIMTRKGHTISGWCERNGWIKRTFERAVNRACYKVAEPLNRNYAVRLHTDIDAVSQIAAKHASFEVVSDNRAPVKRKDYHRADDATPTHIPGSEAEIIKHIEKVNQQRRQEAERAESRASTGRRSRPPRRSSSQAPIPPARAAAQEAGGVMGGWILMLWPLAGWVCAVFVAREDGGPIGLFDVLILGTCGAVVGPFGVIWLAVIAHDKKPPR